MSVRIAICDYGVGNLRSVERAIQAAGAIAIVSDDPGVVVAADAIVLPGVGAFGAAAEALSSRGMHGAVLEVAESGRPVLGVCLGFQLLFDSSEESGGRAGLGLIPGKIARIDESRGKVPHMGWNNLEFRRPHPLFEGIRDGVAMYFVHSYAARTDPENIIATADYSGPVSAACSRANVMGTQFHPEKSGGDGLRIYANFVTIAAADVRETETPIVRLPLEGGQAG